MISMSQPTGRPDYNWDEFATKESAEKMKKERAAQVTAWGSRISKQVIAAPALYHLYWKEAGASGNSDVQLVKWVWSEQDLRCLHSQGSARSISALEDYGLLYRLVEDGINPRISVRADSKELGIVPTFNTIAEIRVLRSLMNM